MDKTNKVCHPTFHIPYNYAGQLWLNSHNCPYIGSDCLHSMYCYTCYTDEYRQSKIKNTYRHNLSTIKHFIPIK